MLETSVLVIIGVAKTKALISCAVTAQLICAFVFAYMEKAGFLQTPINLNNEGNSIGLTCAVDRVIRIPYMHKPAVNESIVGRNSLGRPLNH